jgi:hypothetical protein
VSGGWNGKEQVAEAEQRRSGPTEVNWARVRRFSGRSSIREVCDGLIESTARGRPVFIDERAWRAPQPIN